MYGARQFLLLPTQAAAGKSSARQNKAFWEGTFIMVEEEAKMNTFSFDELVSIFSYLSPQNLSKCSQVCRDWHEASQVGSLWKRHCLQRWNFCHLGKLKPGRWHEMRELLYKSLKNVICLPTEHQGVRKNSFRNVRAFQDGIRIWKCWLLRKNGKDGFANFWRKNAIAHCRNVRALGRVSYIDLIENLNIKTEILMNEKLPDRV